MVCIDEGTANLDSEAERDIQLVLRQAFTDSTVLLIAHRVTSLKNTDRVIVMQDGQVLEDGPTKDMSLHKGTHFYAMLQDQENHRDDNIVNVNNEESAVQRIDNTDVTLINLNTSDE